VGDAAKGIGAQVHVGLGLDLAGAAYDRGQILARDLGGQDLGVGRLLPPDKDGHEYDNGHDGEGDQKYLFHAGCVLQLSSIPVYAIGGGLVPRCCLSVTGILRAARCLPGRLDSLPGGIAFAFPARRAKNSRPGAKENGLAVMLVCWTGEQFEWFQNRFNREHESFSEFP
jgi:hypothetical protein